MFVGSVAVAAVLLVADDSPVTSGSLDVQLAKHNPIATNKAMDVFVLRQLPLLKHLSTVAHGGGGSAVFGRRSYPRPAQTAEEFWREYDAKQKPTPKK